MKLLTYYKEDGQQQLGILSTHGVIDAAAAGGKLGLSAISDIHAIIEGGADKLSELQQILEAVDSDPGRYQDVLLEEKRLKLAPAVTRPGKIICVGLNYRKHAEETNAPIPLYPILFNKFNNALAATGDVITLPKVSDQVDYEAELVIVIGSKTKDVSVEQALNHVFGYCNANDLSARDLQNRTAQWLLGKSCDGFAPLGPYVVTTDEVGNPNELNIRCTVNGTIRQNSSTADMIFPCDEIVSYISQHMTLLPGDIILTGTPEGVVFGLPPEQRIYLQDGDAVTIEIEKLGALTNVMAAERLEQ